MTSAAAENHAKKINSLSSRFDNRNLKALPVDDSYMEQSRSVPNAIFSRVNLKPVLNPKLIAVSKSALKLLDLPDDVEIDDSFIQFFCGNKLIDGEMPAAHCYCGYQFGSFAGQLGDGAAMYLGEVLNSNSERWEVQLKGSGKTPYSRSADGRKVLRSSIREFLGSEAIHFLGIPTTRAATCITSDSKVERDIFYNGNVILEPCTVISRIASNFFRFGSFEIFKGRDSTTDRSGPSHGNEALKQALLEHVLSYFPDISSDRPIAERCEAYYQRIIHLTAELVAKWQTVGFVHGVLNTDNMSVMGLTIDYGPYAFMEYFDPDFTPNGSDGTARYAYKEQVAICKWNLERFGEDLQPILAPDKQKQLLSTFEEHYKNHYLQLMKAKLGLLTSQPEDEGLIEELFSTMKATWSDFTDTFQVLNTIANDVGAGSPNPEQSANVMATICASPSDVAEANTRKLRIIGRAHAHLPEEHIRKMLAYIEADPVNASLSFGGIPSEDLKHELEGMLEKYNLQNRCMNFIQTFSSVTSEAKTSFDKSAWVLWITRYIHRLESEGSGSVHSARLQSMTKSNPTFVLRNWIAQSTIEDAEQGNYQKVNTVLRMLENPFNPNYSKFVKDPCVSVEEREFLVPAPKWAASLTCTCSS